MPTIPDDQLDELIRLAAERPPLPERLRGPIVFPDPVTERRSRYFTDRDLRRRTWTACLGTVLAASVVFGTLAWTLWPKVAPPSGTGTEVAKAENRVQLVKVIAGSDARHPTKRGHAPADTSEGEITVKVSTASPQGWAFHLSPSRARPLATLTTEHPGLLAGTGTAILNESGRHGVVVALGGLGGEADGIAQSLPSWLVEDDFEEIAKLTAHPADDWKIRGIIAAVLQKNGWTGTASDIVVAHAFEVAIKE